MIQNDELKKGVIATQNIVVHLTNTVVMRVAAITSLSGYILVTLFNQRMPDNATYPSVCFVPNYGGITKFQITYKVIPLSVNRSINLLCKPVRHSQVATQSTANCVVYIDSLHKSTFNLKYGIYRLRILR